LASKVRGFFPSYLFYPAFGVDSCSAYQEQSKLSAIRNILDETWDMKRKIFLSIFLLFVAIQFIRPTRNKGGTSGAAIKNDIETIFPMPVDVKKILQVSCYDCHSNNTAYPWYSNIQPVGWWLQGHINDGKDELNFNEFAAYSTRRQLNMMRGIIHEVKSGKMPMSSYLLIHKEARLSAEQKQKILEWAKNTEDSVE
jgi:hypothetical protein